MNDLLQPSVHALSPVLVLKARAVANRTEAEHAEVVELLHRDKDYRCVFVLILAMNVLLMQQRGTLD